MQAQDKSGMPLLTSSAIFDTCSTGLVCPAVTSATRRTKYFPLLSSILVLALIVPLFQDTTYGTIVVDVVSTAILVSAIWAASGKTRDFAILIALAVAVDALRLLHLKDIAGVVFTSAIAGVFFFAYSTAIILADLLNAEDVSPDTLAGTVCGYLMMAMTWGSIYFVVYLLDSEAFNLIKGSDYVQVQNNFLKLIYFSGTTLTTVAYGDITPRIPLTQNMAAIEAMTGQFYIALLVARLVSMQITQRQRAS